MIGLYAALILAGLFAVAVLYIIVVLLCVCIFERTWGPVPAVILLSCILALTCWTVYMCFLLIEGQVYVL